MTFRARRPPVPCSSMETSWNWGSEDHAEPNGVAPVARAPYFSTKEENHGMEYLRNQAV